MFSDARVYKSHNVCVSVRMHALYDCMKSIKIAEGEVHDPEGRRRCRQYGDSLPDRPSSAPDHAIAILGCIIRSVGKHYLL